MSMLLMLTLRKVVFWSHLAIGLAAGLLILLMSVTGVLLGFERQMIAWIDGAPTVARTSAPPLPLDSLMARAAIPRDQVGSIQLRRDPTVPVTVRLRERGVPAQLLDPHTGATLRASGDGTGQAFFSALRRWHRWIGAQAEPLRGQLRTVNGVANLFFLVLVLSGLVLWWPRRWTVPRLRATTLPQWHRAGRVRDFNWHNAFGFWFALPLAAIVVSGAFISFRWPGQLLDLALGSPAEQAAAREALRAPRATADTERPPSGGKPREEGGDGTAAPPAEGAPLAAMLIAATAAHPEWTQVTLTLPPEVGDPVRAAVAEGNGYRPDLRWTLELDGDTGAPLARTGYTDLSPARRLRAWVRFGHTGEVFGVGGQLVATLASAVGALLVWTGFALTWRRWRGWRRERGRPRPAAVG